MASPAAKTRGLRVERLQITNFLAFADATVPALSERPFGSINLFVGPNGAGKSSLLNAIKHLAHRVAENSQMTLSAKRGNETDDGRAAARCFCLEHHDRAQPWCLKADVVLGEAAAGTERRGTVRMECHHEQHSNQPPWTFSPADGGAAEPLSHRTQPGTLEWDIYEGIFPMGWPRLLFKLDQVASAGSPTSTAALIEEPDAWQRFHADAQRLLDAADWQPSKLAGPYSCTCGETEHWTTEDVQGRHTRRGIGYALLDGNKVPLLHGSDGAAHVAYLLIEVHKHERPTVFVLEEPDAFLHPGLQRQLISVLQDAVTKLGHQFFISTHSPYLIDWAALAEDRTDTRVFRVHYVPKVGAQVTEPLAGEAGDLLAAIGHSPASVLQPNGVIWVEGPSDAIYIQTWVDLWRKERAPNDPVRWGFDANIQAFGGMLLPYFRGSGVEGAVLPPEFDALRNSALYGFVVMDRDAGEKEPPASQWWWKCKQEVEKQFSPANTNGRWATWLGAPSTTSIESYARKERVEAAGMTLTDKGWKAKARKSKVEAAKKYRLQVLEQVRKKQLDFRGAVAEDDVTFKDLDKRMRQISDAIDAWRTPAPGTP